MKTVTQILAEKGRDIWSIHPDDSVFDALKLMAEKEIGALVVLDADQLVGIISERDYARKVILEGKSSQHIPTRDIMTTSVVCVRPEQFIEDCMALMTERHIRHLPVHDGERLLGIISIGDIVKVLIAEQKFMIEQLEHYIRG